MGRFTPPDTHDARTLVCEQKQSPLQGVIYKRSTRGERESRCQGVGAAVGGLSLYIAYSYG